VPAPATQPVVAELAAREADGLAAVVRELHASGWALSDDVDLADPLYPLEAIPCSRSEESR
jgi:hypothetical protein